MSAEPAATAEQDGNDGREPEQGQEETPPPLKWRNLRMLWSFARPHRGTLVIGIGLGLITTGTGLATPMITKWLLDGLETAEPIGPVVALLAGLMLIGAVVGLAQWIMLGRMGEHIILDARRAMVRRLFRVRLSALSGRSAGEFVTRVTSDTVLLREAAASSIVSFVNGTVGLVGALVLMAMLDWVLLATTIGTLVVVAALFGLLMPPLARAQEEAQAAVGRVGAALEGAMRAIRTVKASRAEQRESERVLAEAAESARQSVRAVRIEAVAWTIAGTGIGLAVMLVLGIGAYRVGTGALAVSSLVAFLLYVFQIMGPVTELSSVVTQLQSGIAAAIRISEIQDMPVEEDAEAEAARPRADAVHMPSVRATRPGSPATRPGNPATAVLSGPVLTFRGVTARYAPGTEPALRDVSLEIPRIGHTAVVGPSGAGKTTMFSLMLRFLHPETGELTLDGIGFDRWSLDDLRRRIAYVEQDTPLVPGTLGENLRYTRPEATDDELWETLGIVQLRSRVRRLPDGLATPVTAAAISGGERQRVALARALVSRPEILLLDEATAQLDGLTEAAIHESIVELAEHSAVVTIAHRLSTVIDADRIIVLQDGRPRAIGDHATLLESDELYKDLVAALRIGPAPALT